MVSVMDEELGSVAFFNDDLRYGFIARDHGADIFVHRRNLIGVETLSKGQRVAFRDRPGRDGRREAIDVRLI